MNYSMYTVLLVNTFVFFSLSFPCTKANETKMKTIVDSFFTEGSKVVLTSKESSANGKFMIYELFYCPAKTEKKECIWKYNVNRDQAKKYAGLSFSILDIKKKENDIYVLYTSFNEVSLVILAKGQDGVWKNNSQCLFRSLGGRHEITQGKVALFDKDGYIILKSVINKTHFWMIDSNQRVHFFWRQTANKNKPDDNLKPLDYNNSEPVPFPN